ncbi:hypothetical protein ACET3Z_027965 [Daucus carota]
MSVQQQIGVQSEGGKGSRVGKSVGDNGSESGDAKAAQNDSQDERNITDKQSKRVFEHWFLLENEMVDAIRKGNFKLIQTALVRVDYLLKVAPPTLISECLQGDEEALLDEEDTQDPELTLRNFIKANERFVHPNTQLMVNKGTQEGFRMALNQIHYGSLKDRKKLKPSTKQFREPPLTVKQPRGTKDPNTPDILKQFLLGFNHWIEPSVLQDAINGNDRALSMALGQIHHKSLESNQPHKGPSAMYRDALLQNGNNDIPFTNKSSIRSPPVKHTKGKGKSIFFTGWDENLRLGDLWQMFKKVGKFRDIILPKKRDRFGNRIGFIQVDAENEGTKLISSFNGVCTGSKILYLSWARDPKTAAFKKIVKVPVEKKDNVHSNTQPPPKKPIHQSTSTSTSPPTYGNHKSASPSSPSKSNKWEFQARPEPASVKVPPLNQSINDLCLDVTIVKELENSLFSHTVKPETVQTVEMIMEGLGAHGAIVKGISSTRFIASFAFKDALEKIDVEFLKIGFAEIKKADMEDLIPSRRAWVEIRGLPMVGWKQENFINILKEFGEVLQYCKILDDVEFYHTPKMLIETFQMENINAARSVHLMNKSKRIKIIETSLNDSKLHYMDESDMECTGTQEDYCTVPETPLHISSGSVQTKADSPQVDPIQIENVIQSDINLSDNDSLINPPTHREHIGIADQSPHPEEEIPELHTNNWKPREPDSSLSFHNSHSEDEGSVIDDYREDDLHTSIQLQPGILKDLEKLKVKSRRGSVGELHHFLERDMGRVMPAPINEVVPDIGDGDVVDALPPPPSLKRRRTSSAGMETFMGFSSGSLNHMNVVIDKGKSKLYQEFSFNENGALSQRAIKIMEGHKLDAFDGIFKSPVVDLEAPVMRGIRARDVLHHAVLGNLGDFLNMANDAALDDFSVLMPLKEVLRALGYNNQGHIKSNPMHGSVHEKGSSSS